MNFIHRQTRGRHASCQGYILALSPWLLGVCWAASAGVAWGSCGVYWMPGHGGAVWASSADSALSSHLGGHGDERLGLGVFAVRMLQADRELQRARQAGYEAVPVHPQTPCQGPACGGRSSLPSAPVPATVDVSQPDRWMACAESAISPPATRGDFVATLELRLPSGDWPDLVRPPNSFY